jgi:hypothetical protein
MYDDSRFLTLIVCTFVCIFVYMYVCIYVCIYVYICVHVCLYVSMYQDLKYMYVCMYRNNVGRVYSHVQEAGIQVVESDLTQPSRQRLLPGTTST